MLRRVATLVIILGLVVTGCTVSTDEAVPTADPVPTTTRSPGASEQPGGRNGDRPNILLITTDDMNQGDLRWMPQTRRLLAEAGVTVDGFISNHPLCCPARAQMMTGQHAHNNGVRDNDHSRFGGYKRLVDPSQNIGRWLQSSGYRTAFVGKHLNGWEKTAPRQPGWSIFNPLLRKVYSPYGMTMYGNGTPRQYDGVHTADLMGRLTVNYIERFARTGDPFFIWTSQVPPHGMLVDGEWGVPVPAPRHATLYRDVPSPSLSDPAFNEADVADKPPWMSSLPPVSTAEVNAWHQARIRSLRAVDDQVKAAVDALERVGELGSTYVFFTSDNGLMLGEHRLQFKNKPYEPNLRIPLVVRGPGLEAGIVREATYGLVDLAPTLLDVGGATAGVTLDGRSMMDTLRGDAPGYDHYLIQASGGNHLPLPGARDQPWWWRGVRSLDYVYIRYNDGFDELYDMRADPAQLTNLAPDPEYADVKREYADRLNSLKTCAGPTCRR
jgi:arylsulfatase A-like enzyme